MGQSHSVKCKPFAFELSASPIVEILLCIDALIFYAFLSLIISFFIISISPFLFHPSYHLMYIMVFGFKK
jgi:hypothetical protein